MFEIRKTFFHAVVTIGLLSVSLPARAQDTADLSAISLESLMNVKVSSVSRNLEELRVSAAAIYVNAQYATKLLVMIDGRTVYERVDANLSWRGFEKLELSLVGQNLLGTHVEFGRGLSPVNPVRRSVYGKIVWRF